MVVVRLHQLEHLVVLARALAVGGAVVAGLELDDPDALARRAAILLDHTRLEGHRLLEARDEGRLLVVRERVLEANVKSGDLGERVLGAHELHHVGRRPNLDAELLDRAHAIVELLLATAVGLDLAGVAAHDDRVELAHDLEEFVVLLVQIVDDLAAKPVHNHAVDEGLRVVAAAVGGLVGATVGLVAHVDLNVRQLEERNLRLRKETVHVLHHLGEGAGVDQLRGLSGLECLKSDVAHHLADFNRLRLVLRRDVGPAGGRLVGRDAPSEALGDADARAVELADDPLLLLGWRANGRREDEVGGPPEGDRLVEPERRHHQVDVLDEEVGGQVLELGLVRPVEGVHRARAADSRNAALLRLLVDDADQLLADAVVAELALDDARAEALVDEHATRLLAALEVLADALGRPLARLVGAALGAELDELGDGVLLGMVVVRLHQLEHLAVLARALAVGGAVVAGLELDDPDALARRAAILLNHTRLEGHRLLEARDEGLLLVVRERVLEANVKSGDLGERVLGAHELHHVGRRPNLFPRLLKRAHAVVELLLAAAVGIDLAGVAAHDDRVELRHEFEEFVVLLVQIV